MSGALGVVWITHHKLPDNSSKLGLTTLIFTSVDDLLLPDKCGFKEIAICGTDTLFSASRWWVGVQLATAQFVWIKQSLLHLTDWAQDKEGLRG